MGLAMDGMVCIHLSVDSVHDVAGAERESSINQHRPQSIFGYSGLECDQRAKLRIAVLLHHETELVLVQEGFHGGTKWKATNPHEIRRRALLTQQVQRL